MSWSKFIQQLIVENHLTKHHVLTHTEWVYYLRDILNTDKFHCFSNNQPYPLIDKFIPLIKAYDLNQTDYSQDIIKNLKLKDFIHLYKALKAVSYTHLDVYKRQVYNDGDLILEDRLGQIWYTFVTHDKEGSGLGLAICRSILELHDFEYGVDVYKRQELCDIKYSNNLSLPSR